MRNVGRRATDYPDDTTLLRMYCLTRHMTIRKTFGAGIGARIAMALVTTGAVLLLLPFLPLFGVVLPIDYTLIRDPPVGTFFVVGGIGACLASDALERTDVKTPIALVTIAAVLLLPELRILLGMTLPMNYSSFTNPVVGALLLIGGIEAWLAGNDSRSCELIERLSAWYRNRFNWWFAPAARTGSLLVGGGLVAFSLFAVVEFLTVDFDAGHTGTAVALAYLFLLLTMLAGLFFVGIGVSFPGHGSRLAIPPVRFSPLQRVLVTSGTFLIGAVPVVIGFGFGRTLAIRVAWTLASWGVEFLFIGMFWTGVSVLWRRIPYAPD